MPCWVLITCYKSDLCKIQLQKCDLTVNVKRLLSQNEKCKVKYSFQLKSNFNLYEQICNTSHNNFLRFLNYFQMLQFGNLNKFAICQLRLVCVEDTSLEFSWTQLQEVARGLSTVDVMEKKTVSTQSKNANKGVEKVITLTY